jgi:hypothetical protein
LHQRFRKSQIPGKRTVSAAGARALPSQLIMDPIIKPVCSARKWIVSRGIANEFDLHVPLIRPVEWKDEHTKQLVRVHHHTSTIKINTGKLFSSHLSVKAAIVSGDIAIVVNYYYFDKYTV